jgi:hypothetical protein
MQKRLEKFLEADIPRIMDVASNSGPDSTERLKSVLSEYGLFLELTLQDIGGEERTTPLI